MSITRDMIKEGDAPMEEHTLVAKAKGMNPESFMWVTVKSDFSRITRTSNGTLSEGDLRAALHKQGMTDQEIESRIEAARQNPV